MKKLMQTSDEYYNRKTIADMVDEDMRSHEGCRNLAVFIMVVVLLGIACSIFFMI